MRYILFLIPTLLLLVTGCSGDCGCTPPPGFSRFDFVLLDQQGKVLSDTDPAYIDVWYMAGDKKQHVLNACEKHSYRGVTYKSYMSSWRIAEFNWNAGVQTFYLEIKGDVDTLYYDGKQSPAVVRFNGRVAEKYDGQLYLLKQ